jgi:hypothetical protein
MLANEMHLSAKNTPLSPTEISTIYADVVCFYTRSPAPTLPRMMTSPPYHNVLYTFFRIIRE